MTKDVIKKHEWCEHIHKDHLIGWQLQFIDKAVWYTGDASRWNFCPICGAVRKNKHKHKLQGQWCPAST